MISLPFFLALAGGAGLLGVLLRLFISSRVGSWIAGIVCIVGGLRIGRGGLKSQMAVTPGRVGTAPARKVELLRFGNFQRIGLAVQPFVLTHHEEADQLLFF